MLGLVLSSDLFDVVTYDFDFDFITSAQGKTVNIENGIEDVGSWVEDVGSWVEEVGNWMEVVSWVDNWKKKFHTNYKSLLYN